MGRDWQIKPFIDLKVTTGYGYCDEGWDSAYEKIFYGLDVGCDCLDVYDRWIKTDNTFVTNVACDKNQTRAGCVDSDPFPPIRMQ